jgi:AcrR family transcriptional regulator
MAESVASPASQTGLRELKKRRTRELISETARALFAQHGFDRVTIAEIARAAEVSEQTVFNYFPTKEDLIYWRLASFEEDLLAAIRDRRAGTSLVEGFAGFERRGLLAKPGPQARRQLEELNRVIAESPALLRREREIFDRYTGSLASLIAQEIGSDQVEAWVVANALMGTHRALVDLSRQRILAGVSSARIAREVRAKADRALATLENGLASLGSEPPE